MSDRTQPPSDDQIEVDLRQPWVAAVWAWLWPGAGHFYQRRYAKGVVFMVCVLSTYFFGLALGGGHVVYASWKPADRRWQYVCQLGAGLPALPAIVQNRRVASGKDPLFGGLMAPPRNVRDEGDMARAERAPAGPDELAQWHEKYHAYFELGTLYTMIAGLLNILAVYDALAGPAVSVPEDGDKPPPDDKDKKKT